jgi:hypothetical protein
MSTNTEQTIKTTEEGVANVESLVNRMTDAKLALDLAYSTIRPEWLEFIKESNKYLTDFRQWRMAMDGEIGKALKEAQDVRKFFLADDHAEEIKRLREFIELCERLNALRKDGFLDRVADVMLKLEKV